MRKNKTKAIICAAALALLAFPGAGVLRADTDSSQNQKQSDSNNRQTIRGTIDSVRQANWMSNSGNRDQRCIVRLELENGQTKFVDVGSKSKLQDLELNSGDRIQARGEYQTAGGRQVFMADQIRVNGETFSVQRNNSSTSGQFAQSPSSRSSQTITRTVQGQIQGFRHVYLRPPEGQREQHSLVKLQLQDGRSLTVDLGRKRDLEGLNLQKGERITLRGRQGRIDGRSVFFADRIQAGGETVQVVRTGSNSRQGQASSGSNQQSGQFTLKGKVAGYQVITMQSGQKQVSLLNLALADGRTVLIDAGNKASELNLKDLDLRDQAVIQGHTKNLQGRQVLVADSIQFQGPQKSSQSDVGRSGEQQQSSGSGSSASQQAGDSQRQSQ